MQLWMCKMCRGKEKGKNIKSILLSDIATKLFIFNTLNKLKEGKKIRSSLLDLQHLKKGELWLYSFLKKLENIIKYKIHNYPFFIYFLSKASNWFQWESYFQINGIWHDISGTSFWGYKLCTIMLFWITFCHQSLCCDSGICWKTPQGLCG